MTPQQRYRSKLRLMALTLVGTKCIFCKTEENLHVSHVKPTALKGSGRGLDRRCLDALRNPECYRTMCKACHRVFDALVALRDTEEIPF